MGRSIVNKSIYDTPLQKALIFIICLGRMDGVLYEEQLVFAFLILLSGFGLLINFFRGSGLGKEKFVLWQTALLVFFFLSIFWAYSREQATTIWIAYLGRSIVMLYVFSYLFRSKNCDYACKAFITTTAIVNLHFLLSFGISGMLAARAETLELGQGWNANALGMQSVVSCFFILSQINSHNKTPLYKYIILPFLVFFILLTGSKTCFLLLFGSTLLSLYMSSNKRMLMLPIVALLVGIIIYLVFNVPFLYEVMGERLETMINGFLTYDIDSTTSSEGSASDNIRLAMLFKGWLWFLEKPILGNGIGNFQTLFGEINNGKEFYAHNNYIELLVDTGIIGALLYYWIYIYVIRKSFIRGSRYDLAVASFFIVLMIAEFGHVSYLVFCIQFLLCIVLCRLGRTSQIEKI